ncbi:MAG: hypothetical protein LBB53_00090 [Prevotellaceae bacterium]|jgi:hypothetical protein|nr:hypothetical protein [Prevotellaceae bacterium]
MNNKEFLLNDKKFLAAKERIDGALKKWRKERREQREGTNAQTHEGTN